MCSETAVACNADRAALTSEYQTRQRMLSRELQQQNRSHRTEVCGSLSFDLHVWMILTLHLHFRNLAILKLYLYSVLFMMLIVLWILVVVVLINFCDSHIKNVVDCHLFSCVISPYIFWVSIFCANATVNHTCCVLKVISLSSSVVTVPEFSLSVIFLETVADTFQFFDEKNIPSLAVIHIYEVIK